MASSSSATISKVMSPVLLLLPVRGRDWMVPAQEVPEVEETVELGRSLKASKSPSVHESGRFELHLERASRSVMTVGADESTDHEVACVALDADELGRSDQSDEADALDESVTELLDEATLFTEEAELLTEEEELLTEDAELLTDDEELLSEDAELLVEHLGFVEATGEECFWALP